MTLPTDYDARKAIPLADLLDYFPDALRAVANIGLGDTPDDWGAEHDALAIYFMRRGTGDASVRMARSALAILQFEISACANGVDDVGLANFLSSHADALAAVASVIGAGQRQHGTHGWDRAKSTDEANTLIRHFLENGTIDTDGVLHSAKMAWRALALLQKEIEAATGAGISRGSYCSACGADFGGVHAETCEHRPTPNRKAAA